MEGPNPTADLKLDNDPPNWGTCEPKDAFKIKMTLGSQAPTGPKAPKNH